VEARKGTQQPKKRAYTTAGGAIAQKRTSLLEGAERGGHNAECEKTPASESDWGGTLVETHETEKGFLTKIMVDPLRYFQREKGRAKSQTSQGPANRKRNHRSKEEDCFSRENEKKTSNGREPGGSENKKPLGGSGHAWTSLGGKKAGKSSLKKTTDPR